MAISPAVGRLLTLAVVFFFPLVVFWPTASQRYGFRDDYPIFRETHEEPGKIMRVCTSMGRPLYGFLIEKSFAALGSLTDLSWMRRLGAACLGLTAVLLYAAIRGHGWDDLTAALVAMLSTCLPGAQVLVSWAIAWPPLLALAAAVAAYRCTEKAFVAEREREGPRLGWLFASLVLVAGSTLTYQASAFFYLVPLAAGLFAWCDREGREIARWLLRQAVTFGCGLALALTLILRSVAGGEIEMSSRLAVNPSLGETLSWFLHFPLPNALALFAIEKNGVGTALHAASIFLVVMLLAAGLIVIWRSQGWRPGVVTAGAMILLPIAAYGANLLSTERLPSYRTLVPLSALVLVLVTASLRAVAGAKLAIGVLSVLLPIVAWAAHRQTLDLIAWPQARELELMELGASRLDPKKVSRIFIVTPMLDEAPVRWRVGDEFGSLSTNSDWVAKELWAAAVKERFGNAPVKYRCEAGETLPHDQSYDVVVDMSRLRYFQRR